MADVKLMFDQWCGKNSLNLIASTRCIGFNRHKRFLCELSVSEYPYRAIGNSKVREDAERNVFRDFMNYLVRSNKFPADAVPIESEGNDDSALSEIAVGLKVLPASDTGEGLLKTRNECEILRSKESKGSYKEPGKKKLVTATTNVDINGKWTVANATSKVHHFMKVNRITADYKYTLIGPAHARMFVLEMRIAFGTPKSVIAAKEAASKKKLANKLCGFPLVKQLYSKGIIDEFASSGKQEKHSQQRLQPLAKKHETVFPK
uniref:DRBM domain-containing protein n=1 Tax=Glossina morsitans morsitans TaxID=37546 RepID=A0A1B0FQB3_GLOMM